MNPVIVRYRTRPDASDENQQLIEDVFAELNETRPAGLSYSAFRLEDGVSFIHIATITTEDGSNPLGQSEAFARFQAGIQERCDEPPAPSQSTVVGSYG
jgi:hypothetical protein